MPAITNPTYYGARALLERDFADQPDQLARAILMLDQRRSDSFVESGLCASCGRELLPVQSLYCSPQCANEDALRQEAAKAFAAADAKARWAAEDATKAATK